MTKIWAPAKIEFPDFAEGGLQQRYDGGNPTTWAVRRGKSNNVGNATGEIQQRRPCDGGNPTT